MSTFKDTYFDFDDEVATLEDRIAGLNEEADELEQTIRNIQQEGNDVPPAKREALQNSLAEKQRLDKLRKGVVWARDVAPDSDDHPEWDEAVDGITLGAVDGGTLRQLQSDVRNASGNTDDVAQLCYIADGHVRGPDSGIEAPYLPPERAADGRLASILGGMHPHYLDWVEQRIDDLMDPEGNVTGSERSPEATSTATPSTED